MEELSNIKNNVFLKIVIPCFNVGTSISKCLDSILSQKFNDYVIILVDDQSTDNTADVISEYTKTHDNIKYIKVDEKRYAGGCRNAGYQYPIDSEYVWFMDGDDYLKDEFVFDAIYNAVSKKKPDVLFVGYEIHDREKTQTVKIENKAIDSYMYTHDCAPWTKIIRSDKMVLFAEHLKCNEDVLQHVLLIDAIDTFDCLNKVCYVYFKEYKSKGARFQHMPLFMAIAFDYIFYKRMRRDIGYEAMKNKIYLAFDKMKKRLENM